jgi:hypothetical protein
MFIVNFHPLPSWRPTKALPMWLSPTIPSWPSAVLHPSSLIPHPSFQNPVVPVIQSRALIFQ